MGTMDDRDDDGEGHTSLCPTLPWIRHVERELRGRRHNASRRRGEEGDMMHQEEENTTHQEGGEREGI